MAHAFAGTRRGRLGLRVLEAAMGERCGSGVRALAAAALLTLAAAPHAAAQPYELGRVRAAFPGATGERIAALITEAGVEGLPTALLVNKALEGAHKKAPPDQVLRTVGEYVEELREARAAVGREVNDEALKEAADALRRGVPASAIRSLARTAEVDLSLLFVVMFDLMDAGVPPGPAEALVEDALRHGLQGDRMLSLPASVNQLIRGGLPPADAADSVRRQIGGGQAWVPGLTRWQRRLARRPYEPPRRRALPGSPRP